MTVPPVFWLIVFFIGAPIVFYKAIKDPAWAVVGVTYLYFAIPGKEFVGAPGLPYALMLSLIAMVGSLRYYRTLGVSSSDDVVRTGTDVVDRAAAAVRQELIDAIATASVHNKLAGEIRGAALIAVEEKALLQAQAEAPGVLTTTVARAVRSVLNGAAQAGEKEALRIREGGKLPTRGALHQYTVEAVTKVVDASIAEAHDTTRQQVGDVIKELGPDKVPSARGPLAAILTNTGLWLHLLFTVLTYIGALNAVYDTEGGLLKVQNCLLLLPALLTIIMGVRSAHHFLLFACAWLLGVFHLAMNGVNYWVTYGGRADNAGGQGGEANFLGGMCCIVVPIALGFVLHGKKTMIRFAALGVAGIYVLGIIASGSRASLMALAGVMGWWIMRTNRRAIALGVALLATVGLLIAAPDEFWERMGTTFSAKDENQWVQAATEPSKHERLVLWNLAIKAWKTRPLMGIGPTNYTAISAVETTFTDPYARQRGLQTHNAWLQILCEYGVVGFAVWAGAFLYSIVCFFRARARMKGYEGYEWFGSICLGYEAGMLGCIVFLIFNSTHWHDYIYWHFILGPLALQVARDTGAQLDWMKPAAPAPPAPEPRYGPPRRDGLNLDIDLSETSPLSGRQR